MLRAIRALGARHADRDRRRHSWARTRCRSSTADRRDGYVELVIDEMIPAVAAEGLAEWCDVFCETGVFTPDESRESSRPARAPGLKPRIHADELGAERRLAGRRRGRRALGRSSDLRADADGIAALARAGVVATLLPIAAFYLKLGRFAPARVLIDAGVPVALATDVNPGGGFSPSMPFAMTLACFGMGLTFEEALVGATINAACSLDRARPRRQPRAGQADGRRARRRRRDRSDPRRRAVDRRRRSSGTGRAGVGDSRARYRRMRNRMKLDRSHRHAICSRRSGRRIRRRAAAPRRRSRARSARRCWRWWRGCRSRARRPTEDARAPGAAASARCAALAHELAALDRSRQRRLRLVVAAYKLPKATDEEKAARAAAIQEALRAATDAPLDVMRACARRRSNRRVVVAGARQPRRRRATCRSALELLGAGLRGREAERRDQSRQRQGRRLRRRGQRGGRRGYERGAVGHEADAARRAAAA